MKINRREERPGGAANVAEMCSALGAESLLLGNGKNPSRKTRLFVNEKLIGPRIDEDSEWSPGDPEIMKIIRFIQSFRADAIIVADHGKGAVNRLLMKRLGKLNIPIFLDPAKTTPLPCRVEVIAGHDYEMPVERSGDRASICRIEKHGSGGLWLETDGEKHHFPSTCRNCIDPLGAGDQLIATLAIRRVLGDSWKDAIETANIAAGLQCERRGCVPVTAQELETALCRSLA